MGKDWAKGLTVKTDPRVAKNADAHRGRSYTRRRVVPHIGWTPLIAYAVGLIATDGCLSGDGRHITFVTKDEELMRIWLRCVGHSHLAYQVTPSSAGNPIFRVQLSDVDLYRWLLDLG